jgi:protein TonB
MLIAAGLNLLLGAASMASASGQFASPPARQVQSPRVVERGNLDGQAISKPLPAPGGVAGTVHVRVLVDERGNVVSARAVDGPPQLREAATAAARKARFTPTKLSGQPVKVTGVIQYNFVLQ